MPFIDDPRSVWGAKATALTRVAPTARIGVSWHWIGPGRGPSASGPHARCLERVKAWQVDHITRNGWKDIGYNFLICQHARVIEGRGIDYAGSHSPGVNKVHVGVQFMVGEDDGPVTDAMHARAIRLRAELAERCPNIARDWGHRDDPEADTACPGGGIHRWVRSGGPTVKTSQQTTSGDAEMNASEAAQLDRAETEANHAHVNAKKALKEAYNAHVHAKAASQAIAVLASTFGPEVEARVKKLLEDAVVEVEIKYPDTEAAK